MIRHLKTATVIAIIVSFCVFGLSLHRTRAAISTVVQPLFRSAINSEKRSTLPSASVQSRVTPQTRTFTVNDLGDRQQLTPIPPPIPPPPIHQPRTFTVNDLGDTNNTVDRGCLTAGICTLRAAITEANLNGGATINFSVTGTITLGSDLPPIMGDSAINGPGASHLTVSGNNSFRPFAVFPLPITAKVAISGLTIANGANSLGGGCILNAPTLTLSNSVITNCVATGSSGEGGGILNSGNLTITDCTFSNNVSGRGGAISQEDGTLTISNSTFTDNFSAVGGGALAALSGPVTITNSTFNGNRALLGGGALYAKSNASLTNCTISGNIGSPLGGLQGAGIFEEFDRAVTLTNTIVSGNTTNGNPDDIQTQTGGETVDLASSFNLIGTGGGLTNGVNGNIVGVTDPKLAPLANYGGQTQTMALLPNSPAIDQGNSFGLTRDQRGFTRPVDRNDSIYPNAAGGDGSDIGAFESQSLLVTRSDDRNNFCLPGDCSLREAVTAAASGDTITFAAGLSSITLGNEILINKNLTITGPGSTVFLINANLNSRLFHTSGATVTISGMTLFHGNGAGGGVSGRGGAIYNDDAGTLNVTACNFTGNRATDSGGVIYSFSGAVTVTDTTIDGNSSSVSGGAISVASGMLTVNSSTISNNGAVSGGGGIEATGALGKAINVTNSTISGNFVSSGSAGGVFIAGNAAALFISDTITNNSGGSAGGFNLATGGATVFNSIIAANQNNTTVPDVAGTFSAAFDLIGNVGTAAGFNGSTNLTGTGASRLNPGLRSLGDNGGPTRTHSLLATSPAIDRGSSFALTTDQRGLPRPVDLSDGAFPNFPGSDGSDIGAYELQLQTTPITVTRLDDRNTFCLEGDCSLREAITQANASGGATINFSVTGTITIGSDLPAITTDITINGPSASQLTVSGNNSFRPFNISSGNTSISGLTLANGMNGIGGCINNAGTLVLSNSVITNCQAPGTFGQGGGIASSGNITITNATFSNNHSDFFGGAIELNGGGVVLTATISNTTFNGNSSAEGGAIGATRSTPTITNSTFTGNSAGQGGALFQSAISSLINCTISGNTGGASGGGAGIAILTGHTTLTSTIVSGNNTVLGNPNDINGSSGSVVSSFSLIGTGSGLTNGVNGNIVGVNDPKLGPLANNGGPTQTMALLTASPAIDKGKSLGLTTDQRGFTRPVQQDHSVFPVAAGGDGSDIGAFESGPLPTIDSISPTSVPENPIFVTITISGANFDPNASVRVNGIDHGITFLNSGMLTVDIPGGELPAPATVTVTVINPGPISSNTVLLTIDPFKVCGSQTTSVDPGKSGTASIRPLGGCAINGVDGTLNRNGGAGSSATIYASSYKNNPTGSAVLDVGGGFVDLKVTTGVSGDTVTGLFYYPNTITGTNEANLHLLYFDGARWQGVKSSGGVDPVKNTTDDQNGTISGGTFAVTFDGTSTPQVTQLTGTVFTFSTFVPTAVEFDSATVTNVENGNLIEWKTGFEVNNLGFNVYRETAGQRVRINPFLIAGSALMVGSGTRVEAGNGYSWVDNVEDSGASYWLEDVDLDGTSTWHGPFGVTSSMKATSRINSMLLSEINSAVHQSTVIQNSYPAGVNVTSSTQASTSSASSVSEARTSGRSPSRPSPISATLQKQWSIASQPVVKIVVNKTGWYHLNMTDLLAAGLNPGANPATLQMFVGGTEIPIKANVQNPSVLSAGDSIEFYGSAIDTPTSDTQIYWLVSGSQQGKRISTVQSPGATNNSGPTSFQYTVERKDRSLYFSSLLNGDTENWFGAVVNSSPVSENLTVQHLDQTSTSQATIEIALQGVTTNSHQVNVMLDGSAIESISFDGMTHKTVKLSIPQSSLIEGSNQVTLTAEGSGDVSLVDYVRITYAHSYAADSNTLFSSVAGMQPVEITGFTSNQIRAIDVANPNQPIELEGTIAGDSGNYSISIGPAKQRNLLAFTPDQMLQPMSITANQPTTLNKGGTANYLIITSKEFAASIQPFATFKQSQGYSVAVVDVEDIYDEFSYGVHSPYALKDFLNWTYLHWQKQPQYVLLAGSGSLDPKNYTGLGNTDLVPVKLIDTSSMETASDDWFVDFDNDGVPRMAIGRLPVRNAADASDLVSKIISYERSGKASSAVLVSDISDNADFNTPSAQLRAMIPSQMNVVSIVRGQTNTDARTELLDQLSQGGKIINYEGHGSVNLWRGNLLTSSDAQLLTNQKPSPLLVTMTCLNAYFMDPRAASLGESLIRVHQGGPVSVWASSGMTDTENQTVLNQTFFQQLFSNTNVTIGQAIKAAKAAEQDNDVRRTWILFGDPAMKIN